MIITGLHFPPTQTYLPSIFVCELLTLYNFCSVIKAAFKPVSQLVHVYTRKRRSYSSLFHQVMIVKTTKIITIFPARPRNSVHTSGKTIIRSKELFKTFKRDYESMTFASAKYFLILCITTYVLFPEFCIRNNRYSFSRSIYIMQ